MTWTCTSCSTAYAPDSPRCPHCGGTDWVETGSEREYDEDIAAVEADEVEEKPTRRSRRTAAQDEAA